MGKFNVGDIIKHSVVPFSFIRKICGLSSEKYYLFRENSATGSGWYKIVDVDKYNQISYYHNHIQFNHQNEDQFTLNMTI